MCIFNERKSSRKTYIAQTHPYGSSLEIPTITTGYPTENFSNHQKEEYLLVKEKKKQENNTRPPWQSPETLGPGNFKKKNG